jgi:hypothetical protein
MPILFSTHKSPPSHLSKKHKENERVGDSNLEESNKALYTVLINPEVSHVNFNTPLLFNTLSTFFCREDELCGGDPNDNSQGVWTW